MNDDNKDVKPDNDYGYIFAGKYGRGNVSGKGFNYKLDRLCKQINAGKNHKQWVCSVCNRMKDKHEFTHHLENDPLLFYKMKCNLCWIEAGKYIDKVKVT